MSRPTPPARRRHRTVEAPAGRLHLVEQGAGPLVLLVHGFPESWYSWRHQLPAPRGRRVPGGRTRRARLRPLLQARRDARVPHARPGGGQRRPGTRPRRGAGPDRRARLGSNIAATSALLHSEVFRAVGLLSVPYAPPGGPRPTDVFSGIGGPEQEFYVSYFQEPGRAEAEMEPDVRGWLAGFFAALSGDTMPSPAEPDPHFVSRGAGRLRDRFPSGPLPAWLTEDDLDVYAGEFERTGMTGALNRYRAMDRDWEDLAPHSGAPIKQPSLFIGGGLDASTTWMAVRSTPTPTHSPVWSRRTSWTTAGTGSSRNARRRSTVS